MKKSFSALVLRCLTLSLAFLISFTASAQTDTGISGERDYKVRPIRLGVKVGFPGLIGGNLEYVTPLLNNKLAINLEYSKVNMEWFLSEDTESTYELETTEADLSYLEGGFNYYFFRAGKGLYGNLSYGLIKVKGTTSVTNDGLSGTGYLDVNHGSVNVKLGAKLGGLFYFRPEVGYSFSSLPKTVEYEIKYEDGTSEKDTFDFSERLGSMEILFQGFMANIGFGFAF